MYDQYMKLMPSLLVAEKRVKAPCVAPLAPLVVLPSFEEPPAVLSQSVRRLAGVPMTAALLAPLELAAAFWGRFMLSFALCRCSTLVRYGHVVCTSLSPASTTIAASSLPMVHASR